MNLSDFRSAEFIRQLKSKQKQLISLRSQQESTQEPDDVSSDPTDDEDPVQTIPKINDDIRVLQNHNDTVSASLRSSLLPFAYNNPTGAEAFPAKNKARRLQKLVHEPMSQSMARGLWQQQMTPKVPPRHAVDASSLERIGGNQMSKLQFPEMTDSEEDIPMQQHAAINKQDSYEVLRTDGSQERFQQSPNASHLRMTFMASNGSGDLPKYLESGTASGPGSPQKAVNPMSQTITNNGFQRTFDLDAQMQGQAIGGPNR